MIKIEFTFSELAALWTSNNFFIERQYFESWDDSDLVAEVANAQRKIVLSLNEARSQKKCK